MAEVTEGQHLAGKWIASCPDTFAEALGVSVRAGTLNLCSDDFDRVFEEVVWPTCEAMRQRGARHAIPCAVGGVAGWILNNEFPAPADVASGRVPQRWMYEVVCIEDVAGVAYGRDVLIEFEVPSQLV
jgi:hypothetical protein